MDYFSSAYKGDNRGIKYLFGVIIIVLGYILGQVPIEIVKQIQITKYEDIGTAELAEFDKTLDFNIFHLSHNMGFLLMLLLFVITTSFLYFVFRIHGKTFKDIITPDNQINFRKIAFGFLVWFAFNCLFEWITYLMYPEVYINNFKPYEFIVLLLIAIPLLPIQTSCEELVFRGYFMQGLGILTKNKWVALFITAILFSLVHSANPEIKKFGFWTMQWYYLGAGLFLGLLVILDNGLELSLGVHAATNMFGATLVTYSGSVLQTDSVWKTTEVKPLVLIIIFYISAILFLYICYKKYGWKLGAEFWSGRIVENQDNVDNKLSEDKAVVGEKLIIENDALTSKEAGNTEIPWDKITLDK